MSDFRAKMHQIQFRLGELTALPRPLAALRGPTSKGRRGDETPSLLAPPKSYFWIRPWFWLYSTWKYTVTLKPGNPDLRSLEVTETDTIRSGTHDFLLTFHSNHRPISHRFRDKRRFPSKIAIFSRPRVFIAPLNGLLLELDIGAGVRRN